MAENKPTLVRLTPEPHFTIEMFGKKWPGFRVKSEWQDGAYLELTDEKDRTVTVQSIDGQFLRALSRMGSVAAGGGEYAILAITPSLYSEMCEAAKAAT